MEIAQPHMAPHDSSNLKFLSRCPRIQPNITTVEAIEQALESAFTTQPKDQNLLNQQQMKKIAESLLQDRKDRLHRFLEQLQHSLIRRQSKRAERINGRERRWKPALQTIPEEM